MYYCDILLVIVLYNYPVYTVYLHIDSYRICRLAHIRAATRSLSLLYSVTLCSVLINFPHKILKYPLH